MPATTVLAKMTNRGWTRPTRAPPRGEAAIKAKAGNYIDSEKESLHESATQRFAQVRDAVNAVGRRCHDGLKSCAAEIEEHPFLSLLAALGGGGSKGLDTFNAQFDQVGITHRF